MLSILPTSEPLHPFQPPRVPWRAPSLEAASFGVSCLKARLRRLPLRDYPRYQGGNRSADLWRLVFVERRGSDTLST